MLSFWQILKPFKYIHPIIYSVPDSLIDMIDSPVPCFLGIGKEGEFI